MSASEIVILSNRASKMPAAAFVLGVVSVGLGLAMLTGPAQARQCEANETAKLTGDADVAAGAAFGDGVCIDGNIAIIGAEFDVHDGVCCGAAYVFVYNGLEWLLEQKLVPPYPAHGDRFGHAVFVRGGYALVAAPGAPAVYVFCLSQDGWVQCAQLTASDYAPGDNFGHVVVLSGDVIVVTATHDDGVGSAYVYVEPVDGWHDMTETTKLVPSDGQAGHQFGSSGSISADVVVIGAGGDNWQGSETGSAYVFTKPLEGSDSVPSPIQETAKLTASDASAGDFFSRVAISEDTIVVGAPRDNCGATFSGSVYVFVKPADGWADMTETAKLCASDAAPYDCLGYVWTSGSTIVAGAPGFFAGTHTGAAYVFVEPADGWESVPSPINESAKLTAWDAALGDNFGQSVFVCGDTAVIGARGDDPGGSAYVFRGLSDCNNNGVLDICDIANGISEDINGNGIPDECEQPTIACNGPVVLWSPNHDLVDVSSAFDVDDPDGDPVTLTFRVFSDEPEVPETGDGTGRHAPDFKDEHDGARGLLVRSERRGAEDGRYYIFVIAADDGNSGVTTEICVAAVVPHDQNQQSLDDVLAQAHGAAQVVQDAIDGGGELPPPGLCEHGLADPLGPKQ